MKAAPRRWLLPLVTGVLVASASVQWWHGWHDAKVGEALARRAQPGDIRILSSEHCDHCEFARHWLQQYGVRFSECSVEHDAQCAAALHALDPQATSAVLVRGKRQQRFDPQSMLDALG